MSARPLRAVDGSPNQLTIEDLARETGLSVRNLRSHHGRGLLPPPEVRGRVGYYGPRHVERLRLIQELQAEGLKLDGIRRLLAESEGSSEGLLRVKRAADAFEQHEGSEVLSEDELAERLRVEPDDRAEVVAKATRLGLLVPLGDGLYEVPSPSLIATAEQAVRNGIALPHALDLLADIERHARDVSKRFVTLFLEDVWQPFADAGRPDERWSEVAESMDRLRPLAGEALLTVYRRTLGDEVERAFAAITRELSEAAR